MRCNTIAGVLVATSVIIAGCSGGGESRPSASSEQSSSPLSSPTVAALPHSGAPSVRDPLPASVLVGNPCEEALTATQVEVALGEVVVGEPDTISTGPTCDWGRAETGAAIHVGYVTETHQGLSAVYANTRPQSRVWRPLPPIQGFPAVAHAGGAQGYCAVSVGLANDLSVDISGFLGYEKEGKVDPCDAVAQLADMVVTTLRKKAGE
ncbi:MAG: DUF3558 domain-containing protein [Sciscionella sp.]